MKQSYFYFLLFSLLFWSGCRMDKEEIPDVSDISINNQYIRIDREFLTMDTSLIEQRLDELMQRYPEFSDIFFKRVLPVYSKDKAVFAKNLKGFLTDRFIRNLMDTVDVVFSDFDTKTRKELDLGLKLLKYYVPEFKAPNIYTFVSGFSFQRFLFSDKDRDGVGVGLDMFLGKEYPYKNIDPQNSAFSDYLTRSFDKAHLTRKVLSLIIQDMVGDPPGNRLLDKMITNGKHLYILDKVLPGVADSIIMEYPADKMDWVKSNELEMWAFFFDKNLFYETNSIKIAKYIKPSPNSPGMPPAAPGRTANYIGWQIVKAYMDRYPTTTIPQLLEIKDTQKIMDRSRFKPKRK